MKILHYADAHIDAVTSGQRNEKGIPGRIMDFVKSLDIIAETAIDEGVDAVIFAGDAFKDKNPLPQYANLWNIHIMKLATADIPVFLLVGNHDKSVRGGVHTQTAFQTFSPPNVYVMDEAGWYLKPLGFPAVFIALPWEHRKREYRVEEVMEWIDMAERENLPIIMVGHVTAEGASYGSEMIATLGDDLILPRRVYTDPRLDYVALGHLHRHQELNNGDHPPVVYSGSIERVDWGEAKEPKGFVLAEIGQKQTLWEFVELPTRKHLDIEINWQGLDLTLSLPAKEELEGAMVRVKVHYEEADEKKIDWVGLERYLQPAFSYKIVKDKQRDTRMRLPEGVTYQDYQPKQLLEMYFKATQIEKKERERLLEIATDILEG